MPRMLFSFTFHPLIARRTRIAFTRSSVVLLPVERIARIFSLRPGLIFFFTLPTSK